MKNTFELLYNQLKIEGKSLSELIEQRKKFELAIATFRYLRKGMAVQLKQIKNELKSARGKEAAMLSVAKKQVIQNDFALFDAITDTKYNLMMMNKNIPVITTLVEDLGREAKRHCPEDWKPEPKRRKAPHFDTVEERLAYIESMK